MSLFKILIREKKILIIIKFIFDYPIDITLRFCLNFINVPEIDVT